MSDDPIDFAGLKAILGAEKAFEEISAQALESLAMLSEVNLLNLPSRKKQKTIRLFAINKIFVAVGSKEFRRRVEEEVGRNGGRQLTTDETLRLLADHDPGALRVGLR
jgi:hypothetical protein